MCSYWGTAFNWQELRRQDKAAGILWPNKSLSGTRERNVPQLKAAAYSCDNLPPWALSFAQEPVTDVLLLRLFRLKPRDVVVPGVVSSPAWLVSGTLGGRRPGVERWHLRRKLLFMGGHVPKLYISRVRYDIWRQLVALPMDATLSAHDIACSVRAYRTCRALVSMQPPAHTTFCHEDCYGVDGRQHVSAPKKDGASSGRNMPRDMSRLTLRYNTLGQPMNPQPCATSLRHFEQLCASYSEVNLRRAVCICVYSARAIIMLAGPASVVQHPPRPPPSCARAHILTLIYPLLDILFHSLQILCGLDCRFISR